MATTNSFITFVNHASVIFSHKNIRLMTDPWIFGSAFNNGWRLLSESKFKIEDFENLWDVAIVNWGPAELEKELGNCEIQLALAKVPMESGMEELGVSVDGGNAIMMAYHTYKCPHLCCKPVFTDEGKSTISGKDYDVYFKDAQDFVERMKEFIQKQ